MPTFLLQKLSYRNISQEMCVMWLRAKFSLPYAMDCSSQRRDPFRVPMTVSVYQYFSWHNMLNCLAQMGCGYIHLSLTISTPGYPLWTQTFKMDVHWSVVPQCGNWRNKSRFSSSFQSFLPELIGAWHLQLRLGMRMWMYVQSERSQGRVTSSSSVPALSIWPTEYPEFFVKQWSIVMQTNTQ